MLPVDVTGRTTHGHGRDRVCRAPLFVLPNGGGLGYGLFVLDDGSRDYLLEHIEDIPDALTRGSAWVTLWDNLLEASRVDAGALLDAALRALPREDRRAERAARAGVRHARVLAVHPAGGAESRARRRSRRRCGPGSSARRTQSQKAAWFNAYRDIVLTRDGVAWLERVWRREEKVPGLTLAEPDEIAMALELAVREVPGWDEILRDAARADAESRSQGAIRVRRCRRSRPIRRCASRRSRASASSRTGAASRGCSSRCSI